MRQRCLDLLNNNKNPLITSIKTLAELERLNKNKNLEVKVFSTIPPYLMYQIGKEIKFRFYGEKVATRESEDFYIFDANSETSKFAQDKFKNIWQITYIRNLKDNEEKPACHLNEYFYIYHNTTTPYPFVDIFDIETGWFIEENKIIVCESNLFLDDSEIFYRGEKFTTNSTKFSELSKVIGNNINNFNKNTIKTLWELKFAGKTEFPNNVEYHRLSKISN